MIGSPTTKKPTLPAVSESSISTSVTEDTTNKTNGLSSKSSSTQEENKVNIVEETNLIEKEETSEPVAVREIKLNDENVENVENIENIENVDETEHSDKKLKVKIGNLRDFISRYSNAVFVKLQHEFDELDRRMYSGVDPSEVKAREINDYKNEREELLERPDTETDAQSNGDVRATLADANDALNERGEKLGELNERLDALGGASSEFARMAAEIRRKEANKKWYQVW